MLQLTMLQITHEPVDWDTVWHSHAEMQLGYVLSGRVLARFPSGVYELQPGDFYAIAPRHLHRIQLRADTSELHGFCREAPRHPHFSDEAEAALNWATTHTLIARQSGAIGKWLGEAESHWHEATPSGKVLAQCAVQLVLHRGRDEATEMIPREGGTDEAPHVGPNDYRLFRKAVEAVEENYANPALDVSAIARHCAVSRSLLDRVFHETLSHGPKEFLQRYRVDRSKQLMRARTHSLSEIALLTGFPDIFAFSRTFKRLTGKPPSRHAKDNAG